MTTILQPAPDLYAAGQPSRGELDRLAHAGVRTVINLRHASEAVDFDEPAAAAALGLRYASVPVTGAEDLTPATVARFSGELLQARTHGAVLVHCASANRVGALVALERGWHHGDGAETALALGRAAGLAGLEPVVAALLATPPQGRGGTPA